MKNLEMSQESTLDIEYKRSSDFSVNHRYLAVLVDA
jgi:hypothetical protein